MHLLYECVMSKSTSVHMCECVCVYVCLCVWVSDLQNSSLVRSNLPKQSICKQKLAAYDSTSLKSDTPPLFPLAKHRIASARSVEQCFHQPLLTQPCQQNTILPDELQTELLWQWRCIDTESTPNISRNKEGSHWVRTTKWKCGQGAPVHEQPVCARVS